MGRGRSTKLALLGVLTHLGGVSVDRLPIVLVLLATTACVAGMPSSAFAKRSKKCPSEMARIVLKRGDSFCIDRYEATLEERAGRQWKKHSPFEPVRHKTTFEPSRSAGFFLKPISRERKPLLHALNQASDFALSTNG
ncbi:MAG: hypothetical protein U0165_06255 [Polyangiaceae bacterium]